MSNKKRILVSAAGTATAWHITNTINSNFSDCFELITCDPLPAYLIPASKFSAKYLQVPNLHDPDYYQFMLEIFKKEKIDIYIPLIEEDAKLFYRDNPDIQKLNMNVSSPYKETVEICKNKKVLFAFLKKHNIPVPKTYSHDEIDLSNQYFSKPILGFGSRNTGIIGGQQAISMDLSKWLLQSICCKPEITVEVFSINHDVFTLCRERLATKEGVCVKARIFYDPEIQCLIQKIGKIIRLPEGICIQLMRSNNNDMWLITDFNIRLAAGTALSAIIGWDLVSACLVCWGNLDLDPRKFLQQPESDKYVARVYKEIIMK